MGSLCSSFLEYFKYITDHPLWPWCFLSGSSCWLYFRAKWKSKWSFCSCIVLVKESTDNNEYFNSLERACSPTHRYVMCRYRFNFDKAGLQYSFCQSVKIICFYVGQLLLYYSTTHMDYNFILSFLLTQYRQVAYR